MHLISPRSKNREKTLQIKQKYKLHQISLSNVRFFIM